MNKKDLVTVSDIFICFEIVIKNQSWRGDAAGFHVWDKCSLSYLFSAIVS